MLPEYQGQGYGFEACQAVLSEAKGEYNLDQILAITAPDNLISQSLLAKLGFEPWQQTEDSTQEPTKIYSLNL